jgi:hypothetical protein
MIYYIGLNVPARLKTVQPFENSDKNKLFNFASGEKLQATEDSQFSLIASALSAIAVNIYRNINRLEGLRFSLAR